MDVFTQLRRFHKFSIHLLSDENFLAECDKTSDNSNNFLVFLVLEEEKKYNIDRLIKTIITYYREENSDRD